MRRYQRIALAASLAAVLVAVGGGATACTSIMVGKAASIDGSVTTSHTCDSRIDRTWFDIVEAARHGEESRAAVFAGLRFVTDPADYAALEPSGFVPQAPVTRGYVNTAYPCMNDRQVAIGESTFGGRKELRNRQALFPCEELCRFALERAETAREAIAVIDELTREHGYNDGGECLTIADPNEVWHLEIIGCGADRIGAVWAAVRIPDDHVGVSANASRIMEIDTSDPNRCLASKNVREVAAANGWWDPDGVEPFRFCYAYDPEGRASMGSRRREWRVFDLLAPSLELDPNAENYPFSVKPDTLVDIPTLMAIFRDTYEGTEFDMTKFMYYEKEPGVFEKSPYANPFMHYDMMPLFKINGGWDRMGERCIARYYCTYVTITQSRSWLPDPVGGLVWLGWDNPAMTVYAPIYCGITDVPDSWKIDGRKRYSRDCAWWAFNRVADLAAQKWQYMRADVDSARSVFEEEAFARVGELDTEAARLHEQSPEQARRRLTAYVEDYCERITAAWWELGDALWVKYTGKF